MKKTARILFLAVLPAYLLAACGDERTESEQQGKVADASAEMLSMGGAMESRAPRDEGRSPREGFAAAQRAELAPDQSPMPSAVADTVSRQIIKTVELTLEVESVDSALGIAERIATRIGGYVGSVSRSEAPPDGARSGSIMLKVPATLTDASLVDLRGLGVLKNEHMWTEDVTEDYYDTSIRLQNAQIARDKFESLLQQATRVPDVVEVQRELNRVTEEIERMKGHLRRLSSRVAFSTVNLNVTEPIPILQDRTSVFGRLAAALREMVDVFWRTIAWLIRLLGAAIPVALVLAACGWALRWFLKRRKEKSGKTSN